MALPSLPGVVITAPVIGAQVGGDKATDLTLGANTLVVRVELPEADAAGVAAGDVVTVVSKSGQVDAVVEAVDAQAPDENGGARPSVLRVAPKNESDALGAERGETVTVQVLNAVVSGEFLIVPTTAVVGRGEGRGVVVKRQTDGSLAEVAVTVAGSLRGMTAVAAEDAGTLSKGDDVRVG
ncbi:hypothetical protein MTE01_32290 [Microbacterium testaceum]|uniref:Uncharacterized protein n=2 Tax=Microbacterium testaceum TaxID=2033 RepID=A0A4Y3QPN0_MICTE|nr:hypothetical protein MTE01_32290 [Microbacterium testaceum]